MSDLSERLVDSLNATYGSHPGCRAAHAKGVLCAATFHPTSEAARFCRAPHLSSDPVRAHVRFSNGSGNPTAHDGARDGRGMAVKFYVDGRTTDIVALSLPVFFARNAEDLLAFNEARRPDPDTGQPDAARVGAYLADHPEAIPAVTAAMTHVLPASYAALSYHGLHAFGFEAPDGNISHGRYHLVPTASDPPLSDEEAAARSANFLIEEIEARLAGGASTSYQLDVQVAAVGDPLDDPTAMWPDDRRTVRLGRLDITGIAHDREIGGDVLVFDPTRVIEGIALTTDPILQARHGAYAVSVARRTR